MSTAPHVPCLPSSRSARRAYVRDATSRAAKAWGSWCAAHMRRQKAPLSSLVLSVRVCRVPGVASAPHIHTLYSTRREPLPRASQQRGLLVVRHRIQHLLGPPPSTRGMPVCRGCARARCPVFPRPLLSTFPPRAPASSQPSSGGAACGASPHTAHAFGPPPSTRGMLVLGMRPRAVPRVFPPSSFHVPPAWSVSSSLGSLLTYAPVPFLRVACPPGRP